MKNMMMIFKKKKVTFEWSLLLYHIWYNILMFSYVINWMGFEVHSPNIIINILYLQYVQILWYFLLFFSFFLSNSMREFFFIALMTYFFLLDNLCSLTTFIHIYCGFKITKKTIQTIGNQFIVWNWFFFLLPSKRFRRLIGNYIQLKRFKNNCSLAHKILSKYLNGFS